MTNRERLYKGKAIGTIESLNELEIKHKNGWVYGYYVDGYIVSGIMEATEEYLAHEQWAKVQPDSVGQSIGEKDKNGVEIYRGDILRYKEVVYTDCSRTVVHQVLEDALIGIVTYNELCSVIKVYRGEVRSFGWNFETHECLQTSIRPKDLEVIGNIFDNPELLEVSP